jgi:hypothetical protein
VPMLVNAVRELWTARSKCLLHQAHWLCQLLLLVLQPSQRSLHGPWGKRGFTSVGRVSEHFNNRQFQFVSIRERRVIVEWLVLGSWKYIRIKEPLGSSYFQNHKDPPPPAVFRKEPAILRQLIDHLQSFWGVENHGYVSALGNCFFWRTVVMNHPDTRWGIGAVSNTRSMLVSRVVGVTFAFWTCQNIFSHGHINLS